MIISRINVENFRNIKKADFSVNKVNVFIGENNGGKSNILKALTLPLSNDEVGQNSKRLGWTDINDAAKERYFQFVQANIEGFRNDNVSIDEFIEVVPMVTVEVYLKPENSELYYVRNLISEIKESGEISYAIRYRFCVEDFESLLKHVVETIKTDSNIVDINMNLLPIEMYSYSITVPITEVPVLFNDAGKFKYNSIAAERDDFSNKSNQLGSKTLVNLLNSKLDGPQKIEIEKAYNEFFKNLKTIGGINEIFNWQENSTVQNAKEFFENIVLLPNMPAMTSLLKNIRLGYDGAFLDSQGLGYRNLIFILVMVNSLKEGGGEALNVLTIEEPEAHLCVSNERLFASFVNSIVMSSNKAQFFTSSHSAEMVNKLDLSNVIIMNNGEGFALKDILEEKQLEYLAKKPNLDFLKFLFSRNTILVEGPSEEMLIRTYLLNQKDMLNDIVVISLHKGFTEMIKIWKRVNDGSNHKLGIIRDFDDQPTAKANHDQYAQGNVCVETTVNYTLEDDFVKEGSNFEYLKKYFTDVHGWADIETEEELSKKWKEAKAKVMLDFCSDFGNGDLKDVVLPGHIQKVVAFFNEGGEK